MSLGYVTPSLESISGSPWYITPGGHETLVDPTVIPNWHYATNLHVQRTLEVDIDEVTEQARLTADDDLRLTIVWVATGTGLQGAAEPVRLHGGENEISVTIAGSDIGGDLILRSVLTTGRRRDGRRDPLAADRAGSRLWIEEHRVSLEGDSSRFPTEAFSFGSVGIQRPGIAWTVEIDMSDLDAAALSSARLVLNTDHAFYDRLTQSPDSPQAERSRAFLAYDVARQLVVAALSEDEFASQEYEKGSIGQVLRGRLVNYFGADGDDVASLRSRWRESPGELDAQLQAHFSL